MVLLLSSPQQQAAGSCSYARTSFSLEVPDCLSWVEQLRVHRIEFFAGVAGLLPPPLEAQPPLAATAALQQNMLQAVPSGVTDTAGVGLFSGLFSFSLEDDPVVLGVAKPPTQPQQQQQQTIAGSAVGIGGSQPSATSRDASQCPGPAGAADVPVASAAAVAGLGIVKGCKARADLHAPEGLVGQAFEEFLLQANPLRMAAKTAAAVQAYVQQQLQLQQLLQEQQQLLQQESSHSLQQAIDRSLCPHYRVVCSVATRYAQLAFGPEAAAAAAAGGSSNY